MKIYDKGITHGGVFHADDVFSTALLRLLCPSFSVMRVSAVPEDTNGYIVYDIGGGCFDHHQTDAPVRPDGVPYAAFGLLWREYGAALGLSEDALTFLDNAFVSRIDHTDNTGVPNPLSTAFAAYNPSVGDDETSDEAFERAVDTATVILGQLVRKERIKDAAKATVLEAYAKMKDRTVVLERYLPWQNALVPTDALFVIYPSVRGGYVVQCVSLPDSNTPKLPFPEKWRGLEKNELALISGIDGLSFCHKNGFLAAADDLNAALAATKKAQGQ